MNNIENIALEMITPYHGNPRRNEKTIKLLVNSIERYGFLEPITLDSEYVIITGHSRYYAAKELNLKEVPCMVLSHLSKDKADSFRLVDNKTHENSYTDYSKHKDFIVSWGNNDLDAQKFFSNTPDISFNNIKETSTISKKEEKLENNTRSNIQDSVDNNRKVLCPYCFHVFKSNNSSDNNENE